VNIYWEMAMEDQTERDPLHPCLKCGRRRYFSCRQNADGLCSPCHRAATDSLTPYEAMLGRLVRDPWRPSDWSKEPTDVEKQFAASMAKSFEKARDVTSEQTRRIDDDIALLLLAGISFHRITLATYQDEPFKRSILVDGKSVRDYTITYKAEGNG